MEKIVIQTKELAEVGIIPEQPGELTPKLPPPVATSVKVAMSPLVLCLPVLCLVTLAMRVAMRGLPPRTRYAWLEFLATLMIVSGLLTSVAATVLVATTDSRLWAHRDNQAETGEVLPGLTELDSRTEFPELPAKAALSARDVADKLKPLVAVISPSRKLWFGRGERSGGSFGAGILLSADASGYLIMTARHVVEEAGGNRALVAMRSGVWAGGGIVGRHTSLDLALVFLPRTSGNASFVLPIRESREVAEGEGVFVIGHPQGLRFTMSTGIVSRKAGDVMQISAPVSPGNSGGPTFDDRGNLIGIVTSMVDRGSSPNAENLNFTVPADAALRFDGWQFEGNGRARLQSFLNARGASRPAK